MHAMHEECVEKSRKKNDEIEKFWIARMECEVNVMTNEREAAKFEVGSTHRGYYSDPNLHKHVPITIFVVVFLVVVLGARPTPEVDQPSTSLGQS